MVLKIRAFSRSACILPSKKSRMCCLISKSIGLIGRGNQHPALRVID
jgi:hypothetical protein